MLQGYIIFIMLQGYGDYNHRKGITLTKVRLQASIMPASQLYSSATTIKGFYAWD